MVRSGWAVPEEDESIAAIPPAPGMAVADNGAGLGPGPRYGVRPTVMPSKASSDRSGSEPSGSERPGQMITSSQTLGCRRQCWHGGGSRGCG